MLISRARVLAVLLLLALTGSACFSAAPSASRSGGDAEESDGGSGGSSASPLSSSVAVEAARAELDRALDRLEAIHPQPFHAVERAAFVASLDRLKERLPELTPEQAAVELMRTWALLSTERDGHQFALPMDDASDPILPIRVYEFVDGVFVTDAMAPHQDLVGSRIVAVGDMPIDEVLAALEPLVPRDGPATVPAFRPLYLLHVVVLRGLGIVGDGAVPLTVEASGRQREVELEPVPSAEFRAWAAWLPFTGLPPRDGLRATQPSETKRLLPEAVSQISIERKCERFGFS